MFALVDTKNPDAVKREVVAAYGAMFPSEDQGFVEEAFRWTIDCFAGRFDGYQPIDARYHDLEHTLQGTLCLTRMLSGYFSAERSPKLTAGMFRLGLLGILLHDTGYLKLLGDKDGTGAKYTLIHVNRSADFAAELLRPKKYSEADIEAVQHMICCTGVNVKLDEIPFRSELERNVGFALGSSDLLGQMAAGDYISKLPILYSEFVESAQYNGGRMTAAGNFASAEELISKTPFFWEKYVLPRVQKDFLGLFNYLKRPYPDGPNEYVERIEANIRLLRSQLAKEAK